MYRPVASHTIERVNNVVARVQQLPPALREAVVVAAVALVTLLAMANAAEPGARTPDLLAYGLGVVLALTFLLRQRSTVATLVAVIAISGLYHMLNYPGGPPMVALWVALYLAAASGHTALALIFGLAHSGIGVTWRFLEEGEGIFWIALDPVFTLAAVILGDAVRSRMLWADEVNERLRRADADKEQEARLRVDQERLRIAHELHDVLAHTLAVVNVQAGVATEMLDDDREATRTALAEMRRASREAMAELRATVGVLREATPAPRAPAPGLGELDRILDGVRQAGLQVEPRLRVRSRLSRQRSISPPFASSRNRSRMW